MVTLLNASLNLLINYHLKPLVQTLPSYIKDTTHFLLQLQNLGPLPENAILVTFDVSSLYTNIPNKESEEACRHFLNTRPLKSVPIERICDLIRMILGMNNFLFQWSTLLTDPWHCDGPAHGTFLCKYVHGNFEQLAIENVPTETICLVEIYRWHFHDLD